MADRALRGMGLGSKSFEDEEGIEFASRLQIGFDCPQGHHFDLTFASEAELPAVWECPRCGKQAVRSDGTVAAEKDEKPPRTHWDMLIERRSVSDLEELLQERLDLHRKSQEL
ncbi:MULTISPECIES: RNA polymerase-binding protein RbpA [Aestuariimicrobium]|uniref:RNA polymerase-binding protein RbpA n=1 Tax=Aestuariimicrobium TaxID=396388 RepID=UPI000429D6C8|nr:MULTISPECIES: RNA polymerase-binding protein RbpA [Aestuariimicrobium]CAI9409543.1 RNA polymerase-binding protein RbpA [Aestuariimicrobium sp. T2.26MG-19.2B]